MTPLQKRLPTLATSRPDESLPSLLIRNAEHNLICNPRVLLAACGLDRTSLSGIARDPAALEPLSVLMSVREDVLARHSYVDAEGRCRVLGVPIDADFVSSRSMLFCPQCMGEDPYHRAQWGLTVLPACPRHRTLLLCACPKCGRRTGWGRRIWRCGCGQDLRLAGSLPLLEGDEVVKAVVDALLGTPPADIPPIIRAAGVDGTLQLCFGIGLHVLGLPRRSHRPARLAVEDPGLAMRIMSVGWEAVGDWPQSFHDLLDRLRADGRGRSGRFGIGREFGDLPYWFMAMRREPWALLAEQEFVRHVATMPEIATRHRGVRRLREVAPGSGGMMTLSQAACILGRARSTVARLVEGRTPGGRTGPGAPILVSRSEVERLRSDMLEQVDLEGLRAILGIGRSALGSLLEGGLLPEPSSDPAAAFSARRVWRKKDVENWVATLLGKAAPQGPVGGIDLAAAARILAGAVGGTAEVIAGVVADELRPCAPADHGVGLARLRFDEEQVRGFAQRLGSRRRTTLSIDEAARAIGVKPEVLRFWMRRGLLGPASEATGIERGMRVSRMALAAFWSEYGTTSEFRTKQGQGSSRRLALELLRRGIEPVSGPGLDGCRMYLFRRSDVAVLWSRTDDMAPEAPMASVDGASERAA